MAVINNNDIDNVNEFDELNDLENTIDDEILNVDSITDELLRTEWVEEAKQIPLGRVNNEERKLLIQCVNQEPFTSDEKDRLAQILENYRGALLEQKPAETIKNVENNIQLVTDEQSFLNLLDEQQDLQDITMYYPVTINGGTVEYKLELTVNPITDSRVVQSVQDNIGIFKDLTDKEINIYSKQNRNEPLSREEQIIADHITEEISKRTSGKEISIATEFLARQTRLKNSNMTDEESYKAMKQIYSKMNVVYVSALFQRVQEITNINNLDTEKVFRKSD